jgi:hypothetical protein
VIKNYEMIRPGHWHQVVRTGPGPVYSNEYMSYYNKIPSEQMSKIRFDVMCKYLPEFKSVCDVGYGNGAFIDYARRVGGYRTFGYDVSDYPTPEGTIRVNTPEEIDVDVVTFFDSLEHMEQPDLEDFLYNLKTEHIVISLPWMHENLGVEWFESWKHRKPNEHFHHFDLHGLIGLLVDSGYTPIHVCNAEDEIRIPTGMYPNILTVIATRV